MRTVGITIDEVGRIANVVELGIYNHMSYPLQKRKAIYVDLAIGLGIPILQLVMREWLMLTFRKES